MDPTGQFYKCNLVAVGRAAGYVEYSMLQHVYKWKQMQEEEQKQDNVDDNNLKETSFEEMDELLSSISHEDVKECWKNMTFDDVVGFICDCICKVYNVRNAADLEKVRFEGLLITKNGNGAEQSYAEIIHDGIINKCLTSKVPT